MPRTVSELALDALLCRNTLDFEKMVFPEHTALSPNIVKEHLPRIWTFLADLLPIMRQRSTRAKHPVTACLFFGWPDESKSLSRDNIGICAITARDPSGAQTVLHCQQSDDIDSILAHAIEADDWLAQWPAISESSDLPDDMKSIGTKIVLPYFLHCPIDPIELQAEKLSFTDATSTEETPQKELSRILWDPVFRVSSKGILIGHETQIQSIDGLLHEKHQGPHRRWYQRVAIVLGCMDNGKAAMVLPLAQALNRLMIAHWGLNLEPMKYEAKAYRGASAFVRHEVRHLTIAIDNEAGRLCDNCSAIASAFRGVAIQAQYWSERALEILRRRPMRLSGDDFVKNLSAFEEVRQRTEFKTERFKRSVRQIAAVDARLLYMIIERARTAERCSPGIRTNLCATIETLGEQRYRVTCRTGPTFLSPDDEKKLKRLEPREDRYSGNYYIRMGLEQLADTAEPWSVSFENLQDPDGAKDVILAYEGPIRLPEDE